MKKLKVKVSDVNDADLAETNRIRLRNARALFAARPFVTKLWMSMHGGFPMEWLKENWDAITN